MLGGSSVMGFRKQSSVQSRKTRLEQKDIDKATAILDMISFTKENGKDVILIKVGDNVEIKIYK